MTQETIKLNRRDGDVFTGIHWVAQINKNRDKGDWRAHIKYLYVTKNKDQVNEIVSTDGHRLHLYETRFEVEPGYYDVLKNTKTSLVLVKVKDDSEYPDCEPIFNFGSADYSRKDKAAGSTEESPDDFYAKLMRRTETNIINYHYIEDVLNIDESFDVWFDKKLEKPVLFKNSNKKAAVMSMLP